MSASEGMTSFTLGAYQIDIGSNLIALWKRKTRADRILGTSFD